MGVAGLDHRVQALQVVPVGPRDARLLQGVQNRLVVLVDQHCDLLPGLLMQSLGQVGEALRPGVVDRVDSGASLSAAELRHQARFHVARYLEVAAAEVEPHDRMPHRPVPTIKGRQPLEKLAAALEKFLQRVEEQALAEAPWAREEVMLALLRHAQRVGGLVHVVAATRADITEGLEPDRQEAPGHGSCPTVPACGDDSKPRHSRGRCFPQSGTAIRGPNK